MYANADGPLRKKHSEQDFVQLMVSFQHALGPVRQTRLSRANESWLFSKEKYVTLRYKTTWEKDEGEERFVFVIRDGQAILNSYVIGASLPYGPLVD
jgi:hypothetical protein